MATQTTRAASARDRDNGSREPSVRRLWQVPVFVAGLLAVAGVWTARPLWHDPVARQWKNDLAAIRKALDPQSPNTALALALGEDLLDQIARSPERAGEVHFLLGSAYLRRCREVSKEQVASILQHARRHLEEAVTQGVADADHPRLMYRLARVRYLTGAESQRVLDTMAQSMDSAVDDPNEAYEMLTQLYLRLPQPNLQAALDVNAKQLALPTDDEDLLAPARLLRGELLMRLHKRDEARKVLNRIRRSAPAGLYARARLLRAQSCQQDRLWQEAATLWEEVLKDAQEPLPEAGRILFYLGACYRRLDRQRDAARVWERALQEDAESSQAAALGLAELRLLGPNPASALECYERALRDVTSPAQFRNTLIDLAETRRLLETGSRSYAKAGDFERARRLAQLDDKLAPGANRVLLGEVAEAWGQDCLKRAGQTPGAAGCRLRKEATQHFEEAGAVYAAVADTVPGQPDQAKWLWRSATSYLHGQHYTQAADMLKRYLGVETDPERTGGGWYTLAEVYRAVNDEAAARGAYHKCIEYRSPLTYRARYYLAAADIEQARREKNQEKVEDAEKALLQNLDLMRFAPDDEAYEKTLLALADLMVERGNYRLAAIRFEEVVNRYPGNPRQAVIRLRLADCYRRLAAQEDQSSKPAFHLTEEARLHNRQQHRRWLQSAVAHYQKLIDDLAARGSKGPLPAADEVILRQALFAGADCQFDQAQYVEAIPYYEQVVTRYPRQVDALKALKQITRCYWGLLNSSDDRGKQQYRAKAGETIQRIRTLLQQLPETAFGDQPGLLSRPEEERWVEWAWNQ